MGIIPIGEQADDLEAIRRTAAYQDCRRLGPFLFFIWLRAGWTRGIGGYFGGRVCRGACQISASAAVMAITKWSISASEKKVETRLCGNTRGRYDGIRKELAAGISGAGQAEQATRQRWPPPAPRLRRLLRCHPAGWQSGRGGLSTGATSGPRRPRRGRHHYDLESPARAFRDLRPGPAGCGVATTH